MNILCTSCKKKLGVPDSALGKKVRCPACQTVFVVSDANRAEAIAPPAAKTVVPPPMPEGIEEEPIPRAKKKHRPAEEAEPFGPIQFRAIVKNKNPVLKKGNYAATLDEQGLLIKKKKKEEIDLPRGSTAVEHEGKNVIAVEIDGEWVTMALMRTRTYNNRFSQAVVDFMNGELTYVHIEDFQIPWSMFILVILPWGAPIITLGGLAPILIAAAVSGANFAIISKEEWTPGLRVTLAAVLTGLVYLAVFLLLFFLVRAIVGGGGPFG